MARRKVTNIVGVTLRIREGLRQQLEQAAKNNRTSLNNEISGRLAKSFEREKRFEDVFGGLDSPALFRLAAGEIALAKQETLKHAPEDQKAGQATARVLAAITRHVLPEARWVKVQTGPEEAESAYPHFVPTATLAGILVKGVEK